MILQDVSDISPLKAMRKKKDIEQKHSKCHITWPTKLVITCLINKLEVGLHVGH